jgi:hypothetical protein
MKVQFFQMKGWQLVLEMAVPVVARTCAKNSWAWTWAAKERRLLSFHAGRMSLNKPGVVRWVYQATPKPSPLVTQADWVAARLWLTMECSW